ncbi:MAG: TetR family transcriptional regulator [Candidatus Altiarchaeales archaeon]|nr:TetR family transcriptional regulator [Candidatus Altiarchaeales archaeon]
MVLLLYLCSMFDSQIGLREKKHAQTKIHILTETLKQMREKNFDEINVKDICNQIPVSEVTFYNYFPRKSDLILYFLHLYTVSATHHVENKLLEETGLQAIEELFNYTADEIRKHPNVIAEVIVFLARHKEKLCFTELSEAERQLVFPENTEIVEDKTHIFLDDFLMQKLGNAIKKGQLPANTNMKTALYGITSIFYGIPLILEKKNPAQIKNMYNQHLKLLWRGLRND